MGRKPLAKGEDGGKNLEKSDRYDAILDAAEYVFALRGFDGASVREVAECANVAQALIHYHFKTKENLFIEMWARWLEKINALTTQIAREVFDEDRTPTLEEYVIVMLKPLILKGKKHAKIGTDFPSLIAFLSNSGMERDIKIVERYFDPIARRYIEKLQDVLPGISRRNAIWSYLFSLSVGVTMMAQTGRLERLSDGDISQQDIEALLEDIVVFVCGGIRAMFDKQNS